MTYAPRVIAPGITALHLATWTDIKPRGLEDAALGFTVTVRDVADRMSEKAGTVVVILKGEVVLEGLGAFKAGEAFVVAPGLAVASVSADAGWLVIACDGLDGPQAPLSLRPSEYPALPGCDPTPADVLLSDTPVQHDLTLYKDKARNFGAGLWDTTAYHRRSIPFPKFEIMHMVSGWIELAEDGGETHRFEAGDTFLIAKGTKCDWKTGGMKKIFCSFVPES